MNDVYVKMNIMYAIEFDTCNVEMDDYLSERLVIDEQPTSSMIRNNVMRYEYIDGDVEFVRELSDNLKCVVCKKLLNNPWQISCGDLVCKGCLLLLVNNQHGDCIVCPTGNKDCAITFLENLDKNVNPDTATQKCIGELKVHCRYRGNGCREDIQYSEFTKHIAECENNPFCKHCLQRVPKVDMKRHLDETCQAIPLQCTLCNMENISRAEMDLHNSTICEKAPTLCGYYYVGCTKVLERREIHKHHEDTTEHIPLFQKHFFECRQTISTLGFQLNSCLNENKTLQSKVSQLEQRLMMISGLTAQFQQLIDEQTRTAAAAPPAVSSPPRQSSSKKRRQNAQNAAASRAGDATGTQPRIPPSTTPSTTTSNTTSDAIDDISNSMLNSGISSNHSNSEILGMLEQQRLKYIEHDKALSRYEGMFSDLELRLQCQETASYNGVLIWKIGEFKERRKQAVEGRILSLYSQPFYTSRYGYKMCARAYLNGDGVGRGRHLSLFFVVMQGDYDEILKWPFRSRVTLKLLDQVRHNQDLVDAFTPDPNSSSFQKPTSPMNIASGCPLFVPLSKFENPNEPYLKDNAIMIQVSVDVSDLDTTSST